MITAISVPRCCCPSEPLLVCNDPRVADQLVEYTDIIQQANVQLFAPQQTIQLTEYPSGITLNDVIQRGIRYYEGAIDNPFAGITGGLNLLTAKTSIPGQQMAFSPPNSVDPQTGTIGPYWWDLGGTTSFTTTQPLMLQGPSIVSAREIWDARLSGPPDLLPPNPDGPRLPIQAFGVLWVFLGCLSAPDGDPYFHVHVALVLEFFGGARWPIVYPNPQPQDFYWFQWSGRPGAYARWIAEKQLFLRAYEPGAGPQLIQQMNDLMPLSVRNWSSDYVTGPAQLYDQTELPQVPIFIPPPPGVYADPVTLFDSYVYYGDGSTYWPDLNLYDSYTRGSVMVTAAADFTGGFPNRGVPSIQEGLLTIPSTVLGGIHIAVSDQLPEEQIATIALNP